MLVNKWLEWILTLFYKANYTAAAESVWSTTTTQYVYCVNKENKKINGLSILTKCTAEKKLMRALFEIWGDKLLVIIQFLNQFNTIRI